MTRRGAVVRSDRLDRLSAAGWRALWEHGIRTVVDLRNDDELVEDRAPRPPGLATVRVPHDASEDREFWDPWEAGPQWSTPLYYGPHLQRFPERTADAVAAIARAAPGGVAFHCMAGRDRSGLVAIATLSLVGAPPEVIAADYALSGERLRAAWAADGLPDESTEIAAFLAAQGTTTTEVVMRTLADVDLPAILQAGGLSDADLASLRTRLVAG